MCLGALGAGYSPCPRHPDLIIPPPWLTPTASDKPCNRNPREGFNRTLPASDSPAEFTAKAIVIGVLFGVIFGASTVYLGLRAGLTVSASIPIAVLAISVLKRLGGSTILENNIVQTIGSAGESVAGGVVFTIPALIFLLPHGPAYFNYTQILLLSFAGGILGVLMMVPLRRALIVKEHGVLPVSRRHRVRGGPRRGRARRANWRRWCSAASGIGALWKSLSWIFNLFRTEIGHSFARTGLFPNATVNVDISPEYMGVGYVIGPRIAGTMVAGGVLSWLVLLPLMSIMGTAIPTPFPPFTPANALNPATGQPFLFAEMSPGPDLERLHPIHRRGRRARRRADHARPHAADHRFVGARGARRASARLPPAVQIRTERDIPMTHRAGRVAGAGDLPGRDAGPADARQPPRVGARHPVRVLLRHRIVTHHRADRIVFEPDLGDDDRDAHHHVRDLRRARLERQHLRARGAVGRRHHLHRRGQRRQYVAGSQNRLHRRRDAAVPADWSRHRRDHFVVRHRLDAAQPAPDVRHRVAAGGRAAGHADGDDHPRLARARSCRGGSCSSACSSRSRWSCAASIRCRSRSGRTCRSPRRHRSSSAASCAGGSSARPA